jgi:hypothetical protein
MVIASAESLSMRMNDMTSELFNSIPCPTCRVGAGKRCLLHSGGFRTEPHIDRKLAAIEAVKIKRTQRLKGPTAGK